MLAAKARKALVAMKTFVVVLQTSSTLQIWHEAQRSRTASETRVIIESHEESHVAAMSYAYYF